MRKRKTSIIIGMLFAVLNLCVPSAFAANDESPVHRMAISPSMRNLEEIAPGETYVGDFRVLNMGAESFNFKVDVAPYSVANESYTPDYTTTNKYTDIVNWIKLNGNAGSLAPGEEAEISYEINVPSDTHGGAQAATILVTMVNDDEADANAVQTVRQVGYIIYGNVDGEVITSGKVLENKVPGFLFNPPIIGTSLVENTGNVYTRATYKLQVFPLFSDEEVFTNEEDPEKNLIFPDTKRYNEIKWEGSPQLGVFKVRQTVEIFNEKSVTEKLVFLCPIWFLFLVLLILFVAVFWIVSRVVKRKKEA